MSGVASRQRREREAAFPPRRVLHGLIDARPVDTPDRLGRLSRSLLEQRDYMRGPMFPMQVVPPSHVASVPCACARCQRAFAAARALRCVGLVRVRVFELECREQAQLHQA